MQWDSAFPGGNGKLLRATRESWGWDIAFLAESKAREPQPLWFSFRLRGIDGGKLRLRLANSALCLGGLEEWERNRPVYRFPGGTWQRAACGQNHWSPGHTVETWFEILEPAEGGGICFLLSLSRGYAARYVERLPGIPAGNHWVDEPGKAHLAGV